MSKFTTTVITALAILAATVAFKNLNIKDEERLNKDIATAFSKWSLSQGRLYGSPKELSFRLKVFAESYKIVTEHNKKGASWQMGLNQFADMTDEEFAAKYLQAPATQESLTKSEPAEEQPGLGESLEQAIEFTDWSQKGCNTGIYSQGASCKASYAIAAANAVTYAWVANRQSSASQTSAQEIIDCSKGFGNAGCTSGSTSAAFTYVFNNGLSFESVYPYTGTESGRCRGQSQTQFRIQNYYRVTQNNNDRLLAAVKQQPVTAAVDASGWKYYSTGIYDGRSCSSSRYNHFVTIVGFGADKYGKKYWKIEESLGGGFGQYGYVYVARNVGVSSFPCGLPTNVYYPYFASQ